VGDPFSSRRATRRWCCDTGARVATKLLKLREDALHWRAIEDEVVAVDLRTSEYVGINHTGALLWSDLASGATRETLVRRLADAYGVDAVEAGADVDGFVDSLRELDLLEP
jgi:Coenzyme PQQ synthesis protein D (PqqD)